MTIYPWSYRGVGKKCPSCGAHCFGYGKRRTSPQPDRIIYEAGHVLSRYDPERHNPKGIGRPRAQERR